MPCYHPLIAYRSKTGKTTAGAWPVVFNPKLGYLDKEVKLPCGKCIGCRLERSRQWAIRCVHEASLHQQNCFITLTYNDNYIDKQFSLCKRDFVLFIKRLRKKYGEKIRYFHCGEYGEQFARPHHHACIFNFDFSDKSIWTRRIGCNLYRSESLEKLWSDPTTKQTYGYTSIGDCTWESAAYTARYITKKITGDAAEAHYQGREPEYVTMSRRPGIGRGWYDQYKSDLYNTDTCSIRPGIKCRPAKYYDKIYDAEFHPKKTLVYGNHFKTISHMDIISAHREARGRQTQKTPEQLRVSERVITKKLNQKLIRSYEHAETYL